MAKESRGGARIEAHPLFAKLAREGIADATSFRGYVGSPSNDAHVTLYSSLEYPSASVEIARADIVHVEDVPENFLPFGAKVVWVRGDAKVTRRHQQQAETVGAADVRPKGSFVELKKGRLQMRAWENRLRGIASDCSSPCSTCHSECGVCQSTCRYQGPM
jgi:hypothetical protein